VVNRILKILFTEGFRQAEPGEFSRRSFHNGKMDLSVAEGVKGMTEALTESQWRSARYLATGKLGHYIEGLRDDLIRAMAYLDAMIDFPEEDHTSEIDLKKIDELVAVVGSSLKQLDDSFSSGKVASQGYKVALLGAPNAGKSTLLNALLGSDRAIVTDIAGTTRDYLEESCLIEGRLIRLVDTAGLRDTTEKVEKIGIERSLDIAREADLVLHLSEGVKESPEILSMLSNLKQEGQSVVSVFTKSDLKRQVKEKVTSEPYLISCLTGEGLPDLKSMLKEKVDQAIGDSFQSESAVVSHPRHHAAVVKAKEALERFTVAREDGAFDECLAFELREASLSLESILGRIDQEEVFDTLFSEFCVGK
jgi:tRNA modification GTPase